MSLYVCSMHCSDMHSLHFLVRRKGGVTAKGARAYHVRIPCHTTHAPKSGHSLLYIK